MLYKATDFEIVIAFAVEIDTIAIILIVEDGLIGVSILSANLFKHRFKESLFVLGGIFTFHFLELGHFVLAGSVLGFIILFHKHRLLKGLAHRKVIIVLDFYQVRSYVLKKDSDSRF